MRADGGARRSAWIGNRAGGYRARGLLDLKGNDNGKKNRRNHFLHERGGRPGSPVAADAPAQVARARHRSLVPLRQILLLSRHAGSSRRAGQAPSLAAGYSSSLLQAAEAFAAYAARCGGGISAA